MKILSKIVYYFLKIFLEIYVFFFQHVRYKKNKIKLPKGPVVFISNHHSDWDPLYINCMYPFRQIPGLIHDEAFKNPLLGFMFGKIFGCIKRGSSKSDVFAIKEMLKMKKEGKNLLIYPEGDIDFFGRNLPVEISIAKLIKKLDMPVAIYSITGAHLRAPRWSHYPYHSHITYSLNRLITKEELADMDVEELYNIIMDNIKVNEMEFQKQALIKQYGIRRAEWLELGLFMCPKCHKINTMKSHKKDFYCTECGFKTYFNKYSFFEYKENYEGVVKLQTTCDWDDFQISKLKQLIEDNDGEKPIIESTNLLWGKSDLSTYFNELGGNATIKLYKDHLEMVLDDDIINLPHSQIYRMLVQYKSTLEVVSGVDRYRFCTKDKMFNAYLWMCCFKEISNCKK